MSIPSHYIELLKYSKKKLIIDYQIEKISLSFFGRAIKMNNWLTFKDWLEVYEKIDFILDEQSSKTKDKNCFRSFAGAEFFVSNNSIKVEVIKEKFESSFAEIFHINVELLHNFMLRVYISVGNNKTQKIAKDKLSVKNLIDEPYKPMNTKLDKNISSKIIKYTPSLISQEEPYFPQPLSNPEESVSPDLFSQKNQNTPENYPIYKASPISAKSDENSTKMYNANIRQKKKRPLEDQIPEQRETRSKKRLDLLHNSSNKANDSTSLRNNEKKIYIDNVSKCKRKDLFGSDDSETEFECENKTIKERETNKNSNRKNENKTKSLNCEKAKIPNLTSTKSYFLSNEKDHLISDEQSKEELKYCSILNDPCTSVQHINVEKKQIKLISVETERKLKQEEYDRDIQVINQLHDALKCVVKSPKVVEFKTLNHLPISHVLSTFSKYKKILNKHFEKFKLHKQKNVPKIEDLDYMALQNFISEQHLLEMCTFLRENYESVEGVPRFTDLYMNLLIPEWVLAIFMEEHQMNRKEALQQILDQEELNIMSTQMFDNSSFNISNL